MGNKNTRNEISVRLDIAEERINELEDIAIDTIKNEMEMKKNQSKIIITSVSYSTTFLHVIGTLKKGGKEGDWILLE